MKDAIMRAVSVPPAEARRRMRSMRRRVAENDVAHWAAKFLDALENPVGRAQNADPPDG
jgi:trehalose 6-phosphate synthase